MTHTFLRVRRHGEVALVVLVTRADGDGGVEAALVGRRRRSRLFVVVRLFTSIHIFIDGVSTSSCGRLQPAIKSESISILFRKLMGEGKTNRRRYYYPGYWR